jgi:hypothetical protein
LEKIRLKEVERKKKQDDKAKDKVEKGNDKIRVVTWTFLDGRTDDGHGGICDLDAL